MNSLGYGSRLQGSRAFLFCGSALAMMASCGSGGGGSSAGLPGQELAKPGGGTYFVDRNLGGQSSRLHVAEMFWARLVDVHDVDEQGRVNVEPIFRDFAINESIQSDANNYRLDTNPITQKTRLIILRQRGATDDGGLGTFDILLRSAGQGLPPVVPKHDDGSTGNQYSFVARNAALVLRFDDMLDDGPEAQRDLAAGETVRVLVGYPPKTPFPARLTFDPNFGAVANGEFHSTRVLIDLTVSETEVSGMVVPRPINAVGLPPSLTSTTDPNVAIRVPTREDFGSSQFKLLRGMSGVPLAPFENGPVDASGATREVVRAMRSGNPTDLNNGFLLDLSSPTIVGGWPLRIDDAFANPAGQAGFDYILDVTFTTVCRSAPGPGDVVEIGEVFLEVTQASAAPDVDGQVLELRVRSLSDQPLGSGVVLLGNAVYLSTYQASDPVPTGCWISISPPPSTLPTIGVSTSAQMLVRFSEPMDPGSISPFDNFYVVRGDANAQVIPTNLIVGRLLPSPDLKEFTFDPSLPLPHDTGVTETYHVRIDGPTDLAGNSLAQALPPINFEMEGVQPAVRNGGTVLRFTGNDELVPNGLPDLRGQFFLDLERELIRPRPVAYASYPADRLNPVPSIMIPFGPGVQTPLSPLGSKLQTVWRYCDLGWQVLDETKYNLDVFGLAWAPNSGQVINDFYEDFEIRLSHSRRQPDEAIDGNLLPKFRFGGLVPTQFMANVLQDPLSPQKVVHPRTLGYAVDGVDLFLSSSGTTLLPFPLNRGLGEPVTYTWRDTAVLSLGAPGGTGIPLDIEAGTPLFLEAYDGYVALPNQVPSFGLPLLMEYRCYPSNTGLGLNALSISLAINSSALPAFRVFSTGGINEAGVAIQRNPDEQLTAVGGFNPGSNPPGKPTSRPDDNGFYIGQLDAVTRISRVHTVWIDSELPDADFLDPVILPQAADQPFGTQVILEYRGAEDFTFSELDIVLGEAVNEANFKFDARRLNAYGDIFALIPDERPMMMFVDAHRLLGSPEFPGGVEYLDGIATWSGDIDAIDGARFVQMRITFVSNIETLLSPELSAIGIAYSAP